MIVTVVFSDGTTYRVEAESLSAVQEAIANEAALTRYWYDSVTGKRWEEPIIFIERPRLIHEDTQEPVD